MHILFTDCLYYLPVHCHSCCFYIQLHGGIREITSMPVYIFCFILCFILLTRRRSIRLLYTTFVIAIQRSLYLNLSHSAVSTQVSFHLLCQFFFTSNPTSSISSNHISSSNFLLNFASYFSSNLFIFAFSPLYKYYMAFPFTS